MTLTSSGSYKTFADAAKPCSPYSLQPWSHTSPEPDKASADSIYLAILPDLYSAGRAASSTIGA